MKRLIVIAVLLTPASFHALRHMAWLDRPASWRGGFIAQPDRETMPRVDPPVVQAQERADDKFILVISSDQMATRERAAADARRKLESEVGDWLYRAGIHERWRVPKRLLSQMIRGAEMQEVDRGYAIMHRQILRADFSPKMQEKLFQARDREIGGQRIAALGAILACLLIVFATVSGYVRADEATRGYYTNRLRLLAAAGIGAAGFVAYRILT
jgi:hypothetical protein